MNKYNIGWISAAAYATTGYGRICKEVVSRLIYKNHKIINIGGIGGTTVWGGKLNYPVELPVQSPENNSKITKQRTIKVNIPIVPTIGHMAGKDVINVYIQKYNLQLLIAHWDCFAINYLQHLNIPTIAHIPIDAPFTRNMYNDVKNCDKIVAFSKFGYNELLKWFKPDRLGYIPHGIEINEWKMFGDIKKSKLAAKYFGSSETLNILSVCANIGERKQIPFKLLVFKEFLKNHPKSKLFLFTNPTVHFPKGYNIRGFVNQLGLEDHVFFPKYDPIIEPWSIKELVELYNSADIYLTTTLGEGFGVPMLESMACGTPVVGPRNSTIPELVGDHGYIYEISNDFEFVPVWIPTLQVYPAPSKISLLKTLDHIYHNQIELKEKSLASRLFAEQYSWKNIIPLWEKLIKGIFEEKKIIRN